MAKMFYSLDEAASRLGKSTDEVQQMASSGQLQEFRDGDRLMFKVEQVDLLAGDGDDDIRLAEDLEPVGLDSSGSSIGFSDAGNDDSSGGSAGFSSPSEASGISIFDIDETDEADPSAATVMTSTSGGTTPDFSVDPASSGSGLLDLTREPDDTSLGADLMQDVYSGDDTSAGDVPAGGALFEDTGVDTGTESTAVAPMPMAAVAVDGAASGLFGGIALGMSLSLLAAVALVMLALLGGAEPVLETVASNHMAIAGGMLGAIVLFGVIGWVFGRKGS